MSIVATQILLLERVDKQPFIDIYLKSKVSVSFGKQWQSILLGDKDSRSIHWTGPIWRDVFLLAHNLFRIWVPLVKSGSQLVIAMHLLVNLQRFLCIMSIYCRLCFCKGIRDSLINELRTEHPRMFLQDYLVYHKGMIPMDYIGYIGLLPMQLEK
eukprot:39316_1